MAINAERDLIALYNLKTKRQKRQALKEDREKQLLEKYYEWIRLRKVKRDLPMIPLQEPYQKGWKRFFVLRPDQLFTQSAAFYSQLLEKINTVAYNSERKFIMKVKYRFSRKRVPVEIPQSLKYFDVQEWNDPKLNLTEREKALFEPTWHYETQTGMYSTRYMFRDPWRYVLKVSPNIISEVKMMDSELEQQIAEIQNYLDREGLMPLAEKAAHGEVYSWSRFEPEQEKHKSPFKNKPFTAMLDEAKNE